MKKLTRVLSALLVLCLLLATFGCGKTSDPSSASADTSSTPSSSADSGT